MLGRRILTYLVVAAIARRRNDHGATEAAATDLVGCRRRWVSGIVGIVGVDGALLANHQFDHRLEEPGLRERAQAQVDDVRPVIRAGVAIRVDRVEHRLGQHPRIAHAISIEDAQRHDARVGRNQRHQACHVCAVPVAAIAHAAFLGRVVVIVDKVKTRQQPAGQRRVLAIDAGVEHRHSDSGPSGDHVRLGHADSLEGPLRPIRLRVAYGPRHVLSRFRRLVQRVRLGRADFRLAHQRGDLLVHVGVAEQLQAIDRPHAEAPDQTELVPDEQRPDVGLLAQQHDDFAVHAALGMDCTVQEQGRQHTDQPPGAELPALHACHHERSSYFLFPSRPPNAPAAANPVGNPSARALQILNRQLPECSP